MTNTINTEETQLFKESFANKLSLTKKPFSRFLKRGFDIVLSFFGLILLSPLFAIVSFAIKRDSHGPIFYKATRVGKHGKYFAMLKFRTMFENSGTQQGPPLTTKNDTRVTPIGKWLRATKLNEIPQLWNVLKGDMSLVGPRPEDPQFVEEWPAEIRDKILSIRPGMTSPASVIYRNEEELLSGRSYIDDYVRSILPDKLRLDQLYIDNQSFISDLDVLFLTLITFLPKINEAHIREQYLYAGTFYTVAHRIFTWFVVDLIVVYITIGLAGLIWRVNTPLHLGIPTFLIGGFLASLFIGIINSALGLHRLDWRKVGPTYVIDIAFSVFVAMIALWAINRFWLAEPMIDFALFWIMGLMILIALIAVRFRERIITGLANRWILLRGSKASYGERILVVGAGELGELAVWMLNRSAYPDVFTVIGIVDDDLRKQNRELMGFRVIGTTDDISWLVEKYDIGLILFAISNCTTECQENLLTICQSTAAQTIIIPDLFKVFKQSLENLEDNQSNVS